MKSKTIGYACSLVPVEIFTAAGLAPERVIPKGRPADADGRIHPNTCCYVRSMLSDLMDGSCSGLGGFVFANSCDGMRKLFDIRADIKGSPDAFFMDIPKKSDPDSIRYFASVLKTLAAWLDKNCSGRTVTVEHLNEAIRERNAIRSAVRDIFIRQASPDSNLKATDVFPLLISKEDDEIAGHADRISRSAAGHASSSARDGKCRVLMSGAMTVKPEIVEMIEERGAHVAAFDTCFGWRHYDMPVREDTPDPFEAVAERYLLRPPCPRMMGIAGQIEYLKSLTAETKADGVIVSALKYCDQLLYGLPLLTEGIRGTGVPVLVLENDYEWTDMEKDRIRIETFLETIGGKGGSHA